MKRRKNNLSAYEEFKELFDNYNSRKNQLQQEISGLSTAIFAKEQDLIKLDILGESTASLSKQLDELKVKLGKAQARLKAIDKPAYIIERLFKDNHSKMADLAGRVLEESDTAIYELRQQYVVKEKHIEELTRQWIETVVTMIELADQSQRIQEEANEAAKFVPDWPENQRYRRAFRCAFWQLPIPTQQAVTQAARGLL